MGNSQVLALRDDRIARVRVLTIHFTFKNTRTERICNTADVENLKEIFASYKNCIFEERASPTRAQILHALTSEGSRELFPYDEGPPDIYILIILSHGSTNGVIDTDRDEQFTTEEVTRALGSNGHFLQDALKIIFFSPCKGENTEKNVTAANVGATDVSPFSMKILAEPNRRNFAIFYSTMETMVAHTNPEGSWMVKALCNTLKGLRRSVKVLELFRLIKEHIGYESTLDDRQMPQSYVYPHDRTITFCKWDTGIRKDARGNVSSVAPAGREAFYSWKNDAGLLYNRGLALVFGIEDVKLCTALKNLDYQTECKGLKDIVVTLDNISSNGVVERVGSLFVIVFGKLVVNHLDQKTTKHQPEWAIDLGNALVPIGTLTRKVVGTKCPTLASKPKIFIFVNFDVGTDLKTKQFRLLPTQYSPSCLNHQHFLVMASHGRDAMDNLIRGLSRLHVDKKSILQDVLLESMHTTIEGQNVDLIWSTMTYLVDFPEVLDKYQPHYLVERGDKLREARRYSFDEFVKRHAEMNLNGGSLLVKVFGLGQTRFAEELYSRLVVKVDAVVVFAKLDKDENLFVSTDVNFQERIIVIADGWSNLNSTQKRNASWSLKRLAQGNVMLFVTIDLKNDFTTENFRSETFELDVTECGIVIQESLRSRREIKMKRLETEARQAQSLGDFSHAFYHRQSITMKSKSGEMKLADADECAEMIAKSSTGSCFVMSCAPGMGKTTNLRRIAIALQRKLGDFRIIRLNLRDCYSALDDFADQMKRPDDALCFMQSTTKSPVEKDKVESGRVIVLLDSVDEVCPRHRKVTLQLLKLLKNMQIKVLVTTRPQEEKVVADALEGCAMLNPNSISTDDQPKFVAGVWKDPGKEKQAKQLIDRLRRHSRGPDFWSIPLNLIMLTEVCHEREIEEKTFRADDLHGLIIEKCIKDTVKFYNKNDQNRTRSQDEKDFNAGFDRAQELAIEYIFGRKRIEASEEDKRQNVHRYAFFVFIEGTNELRFTHQTYAECLVAMQFVRRMNTGNKEKCYIDEEMLNKIIVHNSDQQILRFVDMYLENSKFKKKLAKGIFSENFLYICIINRFVNIFKYFHENQAFDDSMMNKKIAYDDMETQVPLEILITEDEFTMNNEWNNDDFADYLLKNGACLEKFIDEENLDYMFFRAIESHCNLVAKKNLGKIPAQWIKVCSGRV